MILSWENLCTNSPQFLEVIQYGERANKYIDIQLKETNIAVCQWHFKKRKLKWKIFQMIEKILCLFISGLFTYDLWAWTRCPSLVSTWEVSKQFFPEFFHERIRVGWTQPGINVRQKVSQAWDISVLQSKSHCPSQWRDVTRDRDITVGNPSLISNLLLICYVLMDHFLKQILP